MGMDSTTTKDEVEEALMTEGMIEEEIDIKSTRLGRYEEQTATVEIPRYQAARLTGIGTIKVGWINCAVKERVNIIRCYRCLEHEHRTDECEEKEERTQA